MAFMVRAERTWQVDQNSTANARYSPLTHWVHTMRNLLTTQDDLVSSGEITLEKYMDEWADEMRGHVRNLMSLVSSENMIGLCEIAKYTPHMLPSLADEEFTPVINAIETAYQDLQVVLLRNAMFKKP